MRDPIFMPYLQQYDHSELDVIRDRLRSRGYRVGLLPFRFSSADMAIFTRALVDSAQRHGHSMGFPPGEIFSYHFSQPDDFKPDAEFPSILDMPPEERVAFDEPIRACASATAGANAARTPRPPEPTGSAAPR